MKKVLKWLMFIIGGLFILGVILSMIGGDTEPAMKQNESGEVQEVTAEPEKEKEPEAKEQKAVPFGEVAQLDNMEIKVEGVESSDHIGGDFGVTPDGKYMLIDVSITNGKKEAVTMDSSFFTIVEPDGTEYKADDEAWIYLDDPIIYEEINPKNTKTGKVVFDLPESVQDAVLKVDAGIFGTKSTTMKIK